MRKRIMTGWREALLLCILAIVSLRCEDQVSTPEGGDYLLLTQHIFSHETIIEGNERYVPGIACVESIPAGFVFDESARSLRFYQVRPFPVDSLLQSIVWLSGNDDVPPSLGTGGCSWAHALPVTHVPVQVDSSVVFVGSEVDGVANLVISGRLVKVEAGSDYQIHLRTQHGEGFYRIPPDTARYKFVIEQVDSLKIHNYGWCPKRLVSFEGS